VRLSSLRPLRAPGRAPARRPTARDETSQASGQSNSSLPARAEPMDQRPDPAVIARLRTHYSADAALLERLVGPVPGVTDVT